MFKQDRAVYPDGYAYGFCQLYRAIEQRLPPTIRQTQVAVDKAFVDYSGKVPIVDPLIGEVRMVNKAPSTPRAKRVKLTLPAILARRSRGCFVP